MRMEMEGQYSHDPMFFLFSFVYIFFAGCFIAPPTEFVSAGITVQAIFSHWLGYEGFNFIEFHMKRSTLTMIIHSLLPLGYYISMAVFLPELPPNAFWDIFLFVSLMVPLVFVCLAIYWHSSNGDKHPIAQQLSLLNPSQQGSWKSVASSINTEFRRIDKFTSGIPSRLVVVTDSWIIKTSTYFVYVAHQNDIQLTLSHAVEHNLSYQTQTSVQYLDITVARTEPGLQAFTIRLNALELGDLREKLQSPIQNARNIVIQQSLSERFLKTFRDLVDENPLFVPPPGMELEVCIGCMQKTSDVKLQRHCETEVGSGACVQCYCRPMWCLECLGKWFASRQDQQRPETWLSSKCPCPTCRATFCILDVCRIPAES